VGRVKMNLVKGDFEIILEGFTNLDEPVYIKENISVN